MSQSVILYTQSDCPPCDWTKAYLKSRRIRFVERDVSADADAQAELEALGVRSTPVTVIGETIIIGYKPDEMEKHLNV